MKIKVKTLTGRTVEKSVEEADTVLSLKQQLQEQEGIQVDQIK